MVLCGCGRAMRSYALDTAFHKFALAIFDFVVCVENINQSMLPAGNHRLGDLVLSLSVLFVYAA